MVRDIIKVGDPILKRVAEQMDEADPNTASLLMDLRDTLAANSNGLGLAAPQIGVSQRALVIKRGKSYLSMINPVLEEIGGEEDKLEEGCLSIPWVMVEVARARHIRVSFSCENGGHFVVGMHGLLARIVQHEIDHLDGRLITWYQRY